MILARKIDLTASLQIFQIIRYSSLLLISILLTKSNLSTGSIGAYESFLFIASLISFFWINGIIQSLLPIYNDFSKKNKEAALFNTAMLLFILSLLCALMLLLYNAFWGVNKDINNNGIFISLLAAYVFFSCPSSLIEYIYLLLKKKKSLLVYGIISYGLQIIIVTIPILLGKAIEYALVGLLLTSVIRTVWLILLLKKYSVFRVSGIYIKLLVKKAYPLVLSFIIGGSTLYIDSLIVTSRFSNSVFAIFRYGARELPFVILLANAFSNSMLPDFSKEKLSDVLHRIKKKSLILSHYLFPLSLVVLLISEYIYPIIFNPDFAESAKIFNIYLLVISSRLMFPGTILIGLKQTHLYLKATSIAVALHIALGLTLIQFWGIEGVAFASVLSNLFERFLLITILKQRFNIKLSSFLQINWWIAYSSIIFIVYFLIRFY